MRRLWQRERPLRWRRQQRARRQEARQELELVGDLEGDGVEVRERDVGDVVLYGVEERRQREACELARRCEAARAKMRDGPIIQTAVQCLADGVANSAESAASEAALELLLVLSEAVRTRSPLSENPLIHR